MNPAFWEEANKSTPSSLSGSLDFANDCATNLIERLALADDIDRERTVGTLHANQDVAMAILPPPVPQDASQLPPSGRRKWRNKFQHRRSNNKNKQGHRVGCDSNKENDAPAEMMLAKKEQAPLQLKNKKPVVVSISAPDIAAPMAILPRANDASGGQSLNRPKKNGGQKKHNRHKGPRGRGKAVHHRTRDASVPTHIGDGQGGKCTHPPVENLELPSSMFTTGTFDYYSYGHQAPPLDSVSSGSTSDEAQSASYSLHGHGQFGWYTPYYGVPHHMHGQHGFYNGGTVYYPHPYYPFPHPCYDYSHYYQHQSVDNTDSMSVQADLHNPQGREK